MFGIDMSEIIVILGVALVVLGPEKLPKVVNSLGRWLGHARATMRHFQQQLERESDGLRQEVVLNHPKAPIPAPPDETAK